jgi:GT2 family glycosyltransferase
MSPVLSVIIPTYKRKDSLQRLLEALLAQQGVHLELIVVDQNPAGYLSSCVPSDSRIQQLLLPTPNASNARNQGFLKSKGEFVLFIDDDLIPGGNFCAEALSVFRDYQGIHCFSPLVYNKEGQQLAADQIAGKTIEFLKEDPRIFSITDTISAALFFRREYFVRTGGFDPLLFEFAKTAEDQEFFLRMRRKRLDLYFVPFVEIYHDEGIPGGCELRTLDYWVSREKCMKSWAYRHRIHHTPPGSLAPADLFQLARSGFLNKEVLSSGVKEIIKQVMLLLKSINSSSNFLKDKLSYYPSAEQMNHLGTASPDNQPTK